METGHDLRDTFRQNQRYFGKPEKQVKKNDATSRIPVVLCFSIRVFNGKI